MSEYVCPLCGGKIIKNEQFCRGCQQIAKHSTSDNLEEKPHLEIEQNAEVENIQTLVSPIEEEELPFGLVQKRISRKSIVSKIIIAFCILIAGAAIYLHFENKKIEDEMAYWLQSVDQNTSLNYSDYLQRYPNGEFSVTAEEKIRELKNLELISWNNLKTTNDIDAFTAYFEEYPNTPHSTEIKNKIDIIAWGGALKENSADSYRSYIENVDLGNYLGGFKDLAAKKYEYHSQLETVEGKDREKVIKRIEHIFKTMARKDTNELKNVLDDHPKSFFRIRGLSKSQLIDSIKQIYAQEKTRPMEFRLIKEETSVIKDIYNTYFIHTIVLEYRTKIAIADTLRFELELNKDLYMERIGKVKEVNHL